QNLQEKNKKFEAILIKKDNKIIPKLGIKTKEEVKKIVKDLEKAEYKIINIQKKEIKRNPLPPLITSTLQQEAWQKFHFPAKYTMRLAQNLYEKGYITYHRTDSLNLSLFALNSAKNFIIKNYGNNYYQFRQFKTKSKVAQEAHEAIRPTFLENTPKELSKKIEKNELKLYELIWKRFIASQMSQSIFDFTKVEIATQNKKYIFQATGSILKFDGFLKMYPIKYQEIELPFLEINEMLKLIKVLPSQHFTQPPARYTEATLIKELEKNGIGRPSTYAPILSIIQERNYVEKDKEKKLRPTEIGILVNDLLVEHFLEIVDLKFTAKMEEKLDEIAKGKEKWQEVIKSFYIPFEENLQKKYLTVKKIDSKSTDKKCPKCGAPLVIRMSKYGQFYACSNFPKCKYTEPLEKEGLKIKCPKCKIGEIVEKRTKSKKIFYGCSNWPNCDFALWEKPTGETCPKCGSLLVKKGKNKIQCSNQNCDFIKKV
ncbi:MAG: DNA topoisomerase, partial [Minisyncoccia bacterium]